MHLLPTVLSLFISISGVNGRWRAMENGINDEYSFSQTLSSSTTNELFPEAPTVQEYTRATSLEEESPSSEQSSTEFILESSPPILVRLPRVPLKGTTILKASAEQDTLALLPIETEETTTRSEPSTTSEVVVTSTEKVTTTSRGQPSFEEQIKEFASAFRLEDSAPTVSDDSSEQTTAAWPTLATVPEFKETATSPLNTSTEPSTTTTPPSTSAAEITDENPQVLIPLPPSSDSSERLTTRRASPRTTTRRLASTTTAPVLSYKTTSSHFVETSRRTEDASSSVSSSSATDEVASPEAVIVDSERIEEKRVLPNLRNVSVLQLNNTAIRPGIVHMTSAIPLSQQKHLIHESNAFKKVKASPLRRRHHGGRKHRKLHEPLRKRHLISNDLNVEPLNRHEIMQRVQQKKREMKILMSRLRHLKRRSQPSFVEPLHVSKADTERTRLVKQLSYEHALLGSLRRKRAADQHVSGTKPNRSRHDFLFKLIEKPIIVNDARGSSLHKNQSGSAIPKSPTLHKIDRRSSGLSKDKSQGKVKAATVVSEETTDTVARDNSSYPTTPRSASSVVPPIQEVAYHTPQNGNNNIRVFQVKSSQATPRQAFAAPTELRSAERSSGSSEYGALRLALERASSLLVQTFPPPSVADSFSPPQSESAVEPSSIDVTNPDFVDPVNTSSEHISSLLPFSAFMETSFHQPANAETAPELETDASQPKEDVEEVDRDLSSIVAISEFASQFGKLSEDPPADTTPETFSTSSLPTSTSPVQSFNEARDASTTISPSSSQFFFSTTNSVLEVAEEERPLFSLQTNEITTTESARETTEIERRTSTESVSSEGPTTEHEMTTTGSGERTAETQTETAEVERPSSDSEIFTAKSPTTTTETARTTAESTSTSSAEPTTTTAGPVPRASTPSRFSHVTLPDASSLAETSSTPSSSSSRKHHRKHHRHHHHKHHHNPSSTPSVGQPLEAPVTTSQSSFSAPSPVVIHRQELQPSSVSSWLAASAQKPSQRTFVVLPAHLAEHPALSGLQPPSPVMPLISRLSVQKKKRAKSHRSSATPSPFAPRRTMAPTAQERRRGSTEEPLISVTEEEVHETSTPSAVARLDGESGSDSVRVSTRSLPHRQHHHRQKETPLVIENDVVMTHPKGFFAGPFIAEVGKQKFSRQKRDILPLLEFEQQSEEERLREVQAIEEMKRLKKERLQTEHREVVPKGNYTVLATEKDEMKVKEEVAASAVTEEKQGKAFSAGRSLPAASVVSQGGLQIFADSPDYESDARIADQFAFPASDRELFRIYRARLAIQRAKIEARTFSRPPLRQLSSLPELLPIRSPSLPPPSTAVPRSESEDQVRETAAKLRQERPRSGEKETEESIEVAKMEPTAAPLLISSDDQMQAESGLWGETAASLPLRARALLLPSADTKEDAVPTEPPLQLRNIFTRPPPFQPPILRLNDASGSVQASSRSVITTTARAVETAPGRWSAVLLAKDHDRPEAASQERSRSSAKVRTPFSFPTSLQRDLTSSSPSRPLYPSRPLSPSRPLPSSRPPLPSRPLSPSAPPPPPSDVEVLLHVANDDDPELQNALDRKIAEKKRELEEVRAIGLYQRRVSRVEEDEGVISFPSPSAPRHPHALSAGGSPFSPLPLPLPSSIEPLVSTSTTSTSTITTVEAKSSRKVSEKRKRKEKKRRGIESLNGVRLTTSTLFSSSSSHRTRSPHHSSHHNSLLLSSSTNRAHRRHSTATPTSHWKKTEKRFKSQEASSKRKAKTARRVIDSAALPNLQFRSSPPLPSAPSILKQFPSLIHDGGIAKQRESHASNNEEKTRTTSQLKFLGANERNSIKVEEKVLPGKIVSVPSTATTISLPPPSTSELPPPSSTPPADDQLWNEFEKEVESLSSNEVISEAEKIVAEAESLQAEMSHLSSLPPSLVHSLNSFIKSRHLNKKALQ